MEWMVYSDSAAYADKVEDLLYTDEDRYSLFLGVLGQIKADRYEDYFMATAEVESELAAACLMTPPHPLQLIVFKQEPDMEKKIVRHLVNLDIEVSGVVGDQETAQAFADAWTEKTGEAARLRMDQGLFRIDSLNSGLEKSPGAWKVASKKEAPLLEQWYREFEQETGLPVSTVVESARKIEKFLEEKEVYVWEADGEIVSCMKKARPTRHGISVSFIYTPKRHRRKGYARTLVAEVTEELLMEFDFVILYTDKSNPTSNKIYEEIGYRKIANPADIVFEKK